MSNFIKYFLIAIAGICFFTACDKVDALPFYKEGAAVTLSTSSTTIAPVAADSNKVALTLNWTYPNYATDTSNIKYTIQIDSAGKNFSNASSKEVMGMSGTSFTAKELNNILLAKGYAFNVPVDMDVRVISSYANNNERRISNTVRIKMTPYKIPAKVALPSFGKLFLVGSATQGGWNNPVPTPSQEFVRMDETTWGGIFDLKGGQEFLVLPVNGDWGNKFALPNNSVAGVQTGGDFGFNLNDNFKGPATSGLYKIVLDFQTGKYAVTPFTQQHGLPQNLFIVGGATPGGWNNPVPVPSQKFTRLNSSQFEITVALKAGEKYLLLPENGNWGMKFGDDGSASNSKLAGKFKPEGGDMSAPDVTGNYKITVDFLTNTYKLVKV